MSAPHLADNIVHFCRTLRAAGLPVGPGRTLDAVRAVSCAGLRRRDDFYWTLHASLVSRGEQKPVFDQAFHAFWGMADLLDRLDGVIAWRQDLAEEAPTPGARRVNEAMRAAAGDDGAAGREEAVFDAVMTASAREVLQKRDFERMSTEELALAKEAMRKIARRIAPVPTRRFRPCRRGERMDARRTFRVALRGGGALAPPVRRRRTREPPPIVVLCDISGSMGRYSRVLLHFVHALANDRSRVHAFVFGTRLTNVTRHVRRRDVDAAVDAVVGAVDDWSGGTRIGAALHAFNRDWSRRVLGQGALVLLISDGLDRDAGDGVAREMERLGKSCRRLVWLNPLLRYDAFEPKAAGVRAMLPYVDSHRPVHDLDSLAALADAIGGCRDALL